MKWPRIHRRGCFGLSPKRRTAACGFVLGAVVSLLLVAAPLWIVSSGGSSNAVRGDGGPLAALSTAPAASPQFDISAILDGEWAGEMCPDQGDPIPITFEFFVDGAGEVGYSLTVDGEFDAAGIVGSGACDVSGQDITFHAFLAILNDCDEACVVDRAYEGHFEEGSLVGTYDDRADDELCASCVGGGSWWLAPGSGTSDSG